MAEGAERTRMIKDLENALFTNLKNSRIYRASKAATIWLAFVDGISPAAVALVAVSPFILSYLNIIHPTTATYSAVGLVMAILFALGIFLGKISKESVWLNGAKMVSAGIVITLILFFMKFIVN